MVRVPVSIDFATHFGGEMESEKQRATGAAVVMEIACKWKVERRRGDKRKEQGSVEKRKLCNRHGKSEEDGKMDGLLDRTRRGKIGKNA